ncbi:MAG TPA: type II toxin-antitoxin system PemK/MazF family toxin [Anaerolineales bacterium]
MGTPTSGQIVLIPFPFSDLSEAKMRPAVVLAFAGRTDWILCQITSNPYGDERAIVLNDSDFYEGSLRVKSYARPGKLFTASNNIIAGEVGTLKAEIFQKLIDSIVDLLRSGK